MSRQITISEDTDMKLQYACLIAVFFVLFSCRQPAAPAPKPSFPITADTDVIANDSTAVLTAAGGAGDAKGIEWFVDGVSTGRFGMSYSFTPSGSQEIRYSIQAQQNAEPVFDRAVGCDDCRALSRPFVRESAEHFSLSLIVAAEGEITQNQKLCRGQPAAFPLQSLQLIYCVQNPQLIPHHSS